jgi:hypothetical protein
MKAAPAAIAISNITEKKKPNPKKQPTPVFMPNIEMHCGVVCIISDSRSNIHCTATLDIVDYAQGSSQFV